MRKIVLSVLILTMVMGCFCSCGGNKNNGDANSILDGQVIKIVAWGDFEPKAGSELNDARIERIAAAEEKYGCTVEFVTVSDIFAQMQLAAASGEVLGDVLTTRAHYIGPLAATDALWSIEEIGDTTKDIYNADTFKNTETAGKSYGFWYDPYFVDQVLFFNKEILDRAGIEYPYELVKKGQWTYDAWLDIMKRTTDTGSEIMGCGMQQAFDTVVMKGNDACIYAKKDEKWVQNTADSRVIDSLSFLADTVTKWKVMDDNSGRDWLYSLTRFAEGKYTTNINGLSTTETYFKDMADDYGIVPIPKGPAATDYVRPALELKTYCIQKSVPREKAVALMRFMDEAFSYPLDMETSVEAYYSSRVKDKESLEMLKMLHEKPVKMVEEFTAPDIRGTEIITALEQCSKGIAPVRSTLDSYAGKIQALLDEYYRQN